ncbi:MAG: glycosyltransferase family 39 protein [Anaerolineales bacterium]|nr:glycosyltransferase family 39 protein [Anaerolineales bacterium]
MKNFIKQFSLFEILLTITILGIHVYAATADAYTFPNYWFKRDDAYYYFKVAQNITEGYGSSFDGINLTNGYHPLWMLICIPIFALARFDVILPLRVLLIVIALMQATTSILIYRLIKKYLSHAVAILAATFWSFNFYIHSTVYQMGLETPIAALSVVYLIYKLSQFEETWRTQPITWKQIAWLGFLSAIVMFSRLDLVFLAVIVGVWILFRGTSIRHVLPFDILIIFISMTSSVILRTDFNAYNTTYASSALEATVIALAIKTLSLYFFGVYQHPRTKSILRNILGIFYATLFSSIITAGIYMLLIQFGAGKNFPRSAFALDFGISLLLFTALRLTLYPFAQPNIRSAETPLTQLKSNWRKWLNEGFAFYGVLGGLLIIYMLFNHFVFGTSSPVSGQIKRWWGSLANSAYDRPTANWDSYFGTGVSGLNAWNPFTEIFWRASDFLRPILPGADKYDERFYSVIIIFTVFSFILFLFNRQKITHTITKMGFIPLFAGSGIQLLSYTATAYGGAKEWYWVSQMILLTFGFSFLINLILKPLQKIIFTRRLLEIAALLIAINFAYQFNRVISTVMVHNYFPPDRAYMEVIEFIEENTPPGSVIGMTGGGNVGYLIKDRTIVNMDGLINSYEYFQALKDGQAPIYLREHEMTILFANPRLLEIPPYFGQFAPYLERYDSYGGKDLLYLLEEPKY